MISSSFRCDHLRQSWIHLGRSSPADGNPALNRHIIFQSDNASLLFVIMHVLAYAAQARILLPEGAICSFGPTTAFSYAIVRHLARLWTSRSLCIKWLCARAFIIEHPWTSLFCRYLKSKSLQDSINFCANPFESCIIMVWMANHVTDRDFFLRCINYI